MDAVVIEHFLASLDGPLGSAIQSAYRFPTCGSMYFTPDVEEEGILLVLDKGVSIHEFRETFLELWHPASTNEAGVPLVTTRHALARHLRLNPLFAHHLAYSARHLGGEQLFSEDRAHPHTHMLEQLAFMSRQLLEGSAALAPELGKHEEFVQARRRLIRLAKCLGDPSADTDAEVPDLFARLQVHLRHLIERLPIGDGVQETMVSGDADLPLRALYEEEDRLLAVIPPLSSRVLRQVDWQTVGQRLPDHLNRFAVSTREQLYLIIQAERALDYVLSSFKHVQGADLLRGLQVRSRAVFRQAARKSSHLLVNSLPRAYLLADNKEALHKVLHDCQNRLLNISLEHELLHRTFGMPLAAPTEPLPRQDEPLDVRIGAILAHLEWWTEAYVREMERRSAEERMEPA